MDVGTKQHGNLPSDPSGWVLKSGLKRTLNDEVQMIHEAVINTPKLYDKYISFLRPVTDKESSEGWLAFEDIGAAQMIKDYAAANGHPRVASQKLAVISGALDIVLRRFGMSRKQRRFTVDGDVVPPPNGSNGE
jgi:hypothetical protein